VIVRVNGRDVSLPEGSRGDELLQLLDISASTAVAEVNGEILPRGDFAQLYLSAGDDIELVTIVGGG
jgi:sulfur carrier protein